VRAAAGSIEEAAGKRRVLPFAERQMTYLRSVNGADRRAVDRRLINNYSVRRAAYKPKLSGA